MNLFASVFFLLVLVCFLLLYLPAKNKYASYINALDKTVFPLKDFMPVGFAFLEKIHYNYNNKFDRDLRKQLLELHEEEYNEFYLRAYWAASATYLWLGVLLTALFYLATSELMWLGLGFVLTVVLAYAGFNDIKKKQEALHLKVAMDLPDYISKIIILTSAGFTLRAAMKKVSEEMSTPSPLYQLMGQAMYNMENGMNENAALDQVVRRCNMPEMRRLIAVIEQNLQRGGSEVTIAMQTIGDEMWSNRKAKAQQIAAEAETKILFPMMLMMFSVIIMTIVPAMLGMGF